jgi:hypothetical protein
MGIYIKIPNAKAQMSNECQNSNEECHFIILEFVIDLEFGFINLSFLCIPGR